MYLVGDMRGVRRLLPHRRTARSRIRELRLADSSHTSLVDERQPSRVAVLFFSLSFIAPVAWLSTARGTRGPAVERAFQLVQIDERITFV